MKLKMKKNKILLIMGLAVMMLFSGCTGGTTNSTPGTLQSFNGGSDALTFEFGSDTPPASVRDQSLQPFSIRLLIENIGESDIAENSAFIKLTGFDPNALGITEADTSKEIIALRGIKKQGDNVLPGGKHQVIFSGLKYVDDVISGSYPLTFYANICYPYETKAFALVCVNSDTVPAIDDRAQICELEGERQFSNSGAPVKISNVQQYAHGEHSIMIQFDIVHNPTSSYANIYERGSIDSDCQINGFSASSANALDKRDRVKYTIETGISGLDCDGTGLNTNIVTLYDNIQTITCIQQTEGQAEYEKPISISLEYDYLDRVSKTINIEHIQK